MIRFMEDQLGGVSHTIKRGNQYRCLSSKGLTFLDVMSYIPANTSYSSYLKSYGVSEEKFVFPYEAFTSLEFLDNEQLPPHSAFYSTLTNSNITAEEYEMCQKVWTEQGFTSMRDYLIYYNNLDTKGMLSALQIQSDYYKTLGLCMSKDAISLPGLASKYLYSTMPDKTFFSLYKAKPEIYEKMKANIRGGLSQILTRFQQVGVTKIREAEFGEDALDCNGILGLDVSGMYLSIMMKDQCVGESTQ